MTTTETCLYGWLVRFDGTGFGVTPGNPFICEWINYLIINLSINEFINWWENEWMNEWTNEWTNKLKIIYENEKSIYEWMNE